MLTLAQIKLWYVTPYALKLGQLVSVWTTHISSGGSAGESTTLASLTTSIFPERDRFCHFMIHLNSDEGVMYKTPLDFKQKEPLLGLVSLQSFMDGGFDIPNVKLLLCVKGVGAKKRGKRSQFANESSCS